MAGGTQRRKTKREVAQLHGVKTTPEHPELETIEAPTKEALAKIPGAPKPGQMGASKEYMQALTARRNELAKTDPTKKGGRARTRYSRGEIENQVKSKLVQDAERVLREQLESADEGIAQRAAIKILEWEKGKPTQTVKTEGDSIHTIRYETVVTLGDYDYRELPDAEIVMGELVDGAE